MTGSIEVLSQNLGCCGPAAAGRRSWAEGRLRSLVGHGPDLLILQEAPPVEASAVLRASYDVFSSQVESPARWCRSLVAVRKGANLRSSPFEVPEAASHGSYVAAATVELPGVGPVPVVSLHASPTPLVDADLDRWQSALPEFRQGDGSGRRWHADLVLASLAAIAQTGEVLAVGDWNEARSWDDGHVGTWGAEHFARAEAARLRDLTYLAWREERPTRGEYQIDHALATPSVATMVQAAEVEPPDLSEGASDHQALRLTLAAR